MKVLAENLHSDFPNRGYGSWAQWRRRAERYGDIDVAADGVPKILWLEWEELHAMPGWKEVNTGTKEAVNQAIADRRAG